MMSVKLRKVTFMSSKRGVTKRIHPDLVAIIKMEAKENGFSETAASKLLADELKGKRKKNNNRMWEFNLKI